MSTRTMPGPVSGAADAESEGGGEWVVAVLLFSSTCIIVGLLWDISWHMSIGRDTLWSPPHVLEQIGAGLAGLACGWLAIRTTFGGSATARARAVRFWGFRAPLGAWIAIWGAFAMIFSVPFDNWWHNAYGLDVEILSPPHIVLLAGMIGIQVGAIVLAVGHQNRAKAGQMRRLALAGTFAAGATIAMFVTMLSEYILQPNQWRYGLTYQITAAAFPFLLVGAARAGKLRFGATAAAASFMLIYLVTQWVLVQFPATPRLTPIMRPITHLVAFGFPIPLIAPALLLDLLNARAEKWSAWFLAIASGIAFVIALLAAQLPLTWFLIGTPLAQNDVFLTDHWPYWESPGDWEREFWSDQSPGSFASSLLVATGLAIVSARAGLWWGNWLRRVRR